MPIARAGFQAIMPVLRGHGASAAPDENERAIPPDVLALDGLSLVAALNLSSYQLVGYSHRRAHGGAHADRAAPSRKRVVLAGMGESGVFGASARVKYFDDLITKGDALGASVARRKWSPT